MSDPNCKHADSLIVQRNFGLRWVTCTECHTDFIPVAAARRFLALTETGPREWCAEHDLPHTPPPIGECAFWMFPLADPDEDNPCRRTQVHVIPADYLTEEE